MSNWKNFCRICLIFLSWTIIIIAKILKPFTTKINISSLFCKRSFEYRFNTFTNLLYGNKLFLIIIQQNFWLLILLIFLINFILLVNYFSFIKLMNADLEIVYKLYINQYILLFLLFYRKQKQNCILNARCPTELCNIHNIFRNIYLLLFKFFLHRSSLIKE